MSNPIKKSRTVRLINLKRGGPDEISLAETEEKKMERPTINKKNGKKYP